MLCELETTQQKVLVIQTEQATLHRPEEQSNQGRLLSAYSTLGKRSSINHRHSLSNGLQREQQSASSCIAAAAVAAVSNAQTQLICTILYSLIISSQMSIGSPINLGASFPATAHVQQCLMRSTTGS